jgi:hypothetical protein
MSDTAVAAKTGMTWAEWFTALDRQDANANRLSLDNHGFHPCMERFAAAHDASIFARPASMQ